VKAERFSRNPIIVPHMDGRMGDNVNGPALLRVPAWVAAPLGRYYLYFGHHQGRYIRLAYGDRLEGPWQTYEPGVLDLDQSFFVKHIASPDVLVDEARREIRLYYHGPLAEGDRGGRFGHHGQATRVALSADGIHFTPQPEVLGTAYLRVFRWRDAYYGIGKPGFIYRSADGLRDFQEGHNPFPDAMRHCAVHLVGALLWVYYTLIGECPERIYRVPMDLRPVWTQWRPGEPELVLEPELPWEGAGLPRIPSRGGALHGPAYQLRDPYVFVEDSRAYLLYAVAGEHGIGIAELTAV
jgi:hypothetical protein